MGHTSSPDANIQETAQVDKTDQVTDVRDANAQEHDLSFFQAIQLYPKGVFWSIAMSTAVVMEGYDTKLIGTLFAQPTFQKAFGHHVKGTSYQISAPWQAGLGNGSVVGQLLGLLLAGYLSERFGFRKTMMGGLLVIIALIFIIFFAHNLQVLLAGQILFGKPPTCVPTIRC